MNEMLFYDLKGSSGMAHSLSTQVGREIGIRIVAGKYAAEDLIEDEVTLAKKYQVSRSVIRDAVKTLVGKGLLEVRRGIGTRVRPRSSWGLLDNDVLAWHQSAPPQADYLRQLSDVRLMIEPKAARWAAEFATEKSLQAIDKAMLQMESEQKKVADFVTADAMFHRAILKATNNEFLQAIEGLIYSALLLSIRLTNKDPRKNESSIQLHRNVANAINARDGNLAESHMETLLQDAQLRLETFFAQHKDLLLSRQLPLS